MYLYLLPYVLLLQRPKIRRTFRIYGLIVPGYLAVGIINAIVNFGLMAREEVKGTLTNVAYISTVIVIVLCGATLALGFLLMIKTGSTPTKKLGVSQDQEDGDQTINQFNKGKTADEQAENAEAKKKLQAEGNQTSNDAGTPKLIPV